MHKVIFAIALVAGFFGLAALGTTSPPSADGSAHDDASQSEVTLTPAADSPAAALGNPASISDSQPACSCPNCTCGSDCQCAAGECRCVNCPGNTVDAVTVYELLLISPNYFHCAPCEVAKQHIVPWIEAGGFWQVTQCEADRDDVFDGFPTWIVMRDGVEVHRWQGAQWSQAGRAEIHANLNHAKTVEPPPTQADFDSLAGEATPTYQVGYTTSQPASRSYATTQTWTVTRFRQREVCEACGRPFRRGRGRH